MYTDNRGGAHEPKLVIGQLETRDMHIDVGNLLIWMLYGLRWFGFLDRSVRKYLGSPNLISKD